MHPMPSEPYAGSDAHIFQSEFLPLMGDVYRFAFGLTRDRSRADDLVQETYIKAWGSIGRYSPGTQAKAWLFKVCRNTFINDYRTRKRAPARVEIEQPDSTKHPNERTDVVESTADERVGDEVTTALLSLNEWERKVVLLDLEDFSYLEMAEILQVPIGTIRSRLHRARCRLELLLENYARQEGYLSNEPPAFAQEVPGQLVMK